MSARRLLPAEKVWCVRWYSKWSQEWVTGACMDERSARSHFKQMVVSDVPCVLLAATVDWAVIEETGTHVKENQHIPTPLIEVLKDLDVDAPTVS